MSISGQDQCKGFPIKLTIWAAKTFGLIQALCNSLRSSAPTRRSCQRRILVQASGRFEVWRRRTFQYWCSTGRRESCQRSRGHALAIHWINFRGNRRRRISWRNNLCKRKFREGRWRNWQWQCDLVSRKSFRVERLLRSENKKVEISKGFHNSRQLTQ